MSVVPSRDILNLFKSDLWKDQRRLERVRIDGRECLSKYFTNQLEAEREVQIISHLSRILNRACVPEILATDSDHHVLSYIQGIRVFNLFVELDRLEPPMNASGQYLKRRMLARCEANQKEIQAALISMPRQIGNRPYPASQKVASIVKILAGALGMMIKYEVLDEELQRLHDTWEQLATVPFRDASVKNMVLAAPELWLGNFDSEDSRRQFLFTTITGESLPDWFDAQIYDFDFSSCVDNSTEEDDPISLLFHERTWMGPPQDSGQLVWSATPNARRAGITFLVRYFRFGGRKAAYRLLHPRGHRIRFRHDNDVFYFSRLRGIVEHLWPNAADEFPEMLAFASSLGSLLGGVRPEVDYFMASRLGEKRRYYVDMYPE